MTIPLFSPFRRHALLSLCTSFVWSLDMPLDALLSSILNTLNQVGLQFEI